jgi:hypothetical protein
MLAGRHDRSSSGIRQRQPSKESNVRVANRSRQGYRSKSSRDVTLVSGIDLRTTTQKIDDLNQELQELELTVRSSSRTVHMIISHIVVLFSSLSSISIILFSFKST